MQNNQTSVGDSIEARCTKCRKNVTHKILTLEEGVPAQVECGNCQRQHAYRKPTAVKKPAARKVVAGKTLEQKEWQALSQEMDSGKAQDYSMTSNYKLNALISHPVFGLGVVQRVTGAQKIEVLFEDGRKMMRCK